MKLAISLRYPLLLSVGLVGTLAVVATLGPAVWSFISLEGRARKEMPAGHAAAEVLPPPMALMEMQLVLSRAVEETIELDEANAEFIRLQKDYQDSVDRPPGEPHGLERHFRGAG